MKLLIETSDSDLEIDIVGDILRLEIIHKDKPATIFLTKEQTSVLGQYLIAVSEVL